MTFNLKPWKLEVSAGSGSQKDLVLRFTKSETAETSFSIFDQEISVEFDLRDFQPKPRDFQPELEGFSPHLHRLSAIPYFSEQASVPSPRHSLELRDLVADQRRGHQGLLLPGNKRTGSQH